MGKHLVIAGHGGSDPGASGSGTNERDFLRQSFIPAMKRYAPSDMDFHTKDNFYQKRHALNLSGYDEVTELHLDWAKGASGGHVIIFKQYKPDDIDKTIRDTIKRHVGLRSGDGFSYRDDLFNLNVFANRGITYRLVELGFINNSTDMQKIRDNIDDYAKDLVDALTNNKSVKKAKPTRPPKEPEKSEPSLHLVVDEKWGNATSEALQAAFGTPEDGILSNQRRNSVTEALYGDTVRFSSSGGSTVIRALQEFLNSQGFSLVVDGLLGDQTIRALQSYLGTVVDGVLSRPSMVVGEMQKRLNAGTFAA